MNLKMIDGALVIETSDAGKALTTGDFADKPLTLATEPAFYVALGANGLLERTVSVTVEDRKTVAALVGNWIAEGFQPIPCDVKTFAKHVRALVAANKPAAVKPEGGDVAPTGGAPTGDGQPGAPTDGGQDLAPAAGAGKDI